MRQQRRRHLLIITLLLFLSIDANGKRDSLLWVGIKNVSITFQSGSSDSALVSARQLLTIAEQRDDALALSQLHSLIAFCLKEQGREQDAMQEFAQSVAIGEAHQFLQKATKARHDLYYTIMLPAYSLLTTYYNKKGQTANSVGYAKEGIAWVTSCNNVPLRVNAMSAFSEVLMDHKEYMLLYEPMKQAVADAVKQHQTDVALQMTAYLVQIESHALHRAPADIPWIKAGRELMAYAKTEHSKTLFLSAVSSVDKEDTSEHTVKETEKTSTIPLQAEDENEERQDSIQTRVQYIQVRNQRIVVVVVILALLLVVFFGYILWQRHLRRRKEQEAEMKMKAQYIKGLEQERNRLAKELHDGVSNQLLAVEMKLNEEGTKEQAIQMLNESREQVRRVSHELMPPEFSYATLDEVISHYVLELDEANHCDISCHLNPPDPDWSAIPPQEALEIYRIVQEAVGNALKHSGATTIAVGMHKTGQETAITISDNGTSEEKTTTSGIGMRTMKQRAQLIGATLEFRKNKYGHVVKLNIE